MVDESLNLIFKFAFTELCILKCNTFIDFLSYIYEKKDFLTRSNSLTDGWLFLMFMESMKVINGITVLFQ